MRVRAHAPFCRTGLLIVPVLVALVALGLPGIASAATSRLYTGNSFGPDGAGGTESFPNLKGLAVDQTDDTVYALEIPRLFTETGAVYKFDADGAPANFSALGSNHIDGIGGSGENAETQIAVAPAGSPGGTSGFIYVAENTSAVTVFEPSGEEAGELELPGEEVCGVATDSAGHVFVGSYPSTIREYVPSGGVITAADETGESAGVVSEVCNVAADGLGNLYAASYDRETLLRLGGIGDSEPKTLVPGGAPITIDPATDSLYADSGDGVAVYGADGEVEGEFGLGQLAQSFGVAVDSSSERAYVADGGSGTIKVFSPPLTLPITEAATAARTESAVLNGTVFPEGRQYTACRFQYGLESAAGFEHEADCEPAAAQIPADSSSHAVSLGLSSLQPDRDYKFRLVATNSVGVAEGHTLTFNTVGPPRITEVLARDAGQDSATLEATVDARGAATTTGYRIEWGPTAAYGNVAAVGSIAPGEGPKPVVARIGGLAAATFYHYRVVAADAEGGETVSPDQRVETLNSCGFTDGRCLELVSRAEKGPLASPGKSFTGASVQFQAATQGGALAYAVVFGYPEATVGDGAVYLSRRGPGAWTSEQLSPPTLAPPLEKANNSSVQVLSSDLGCGVVSSYATLAPGAPASIVEAGGSNLYRHDVASDSYEAITDLPPVGPPSWEEVALKSAMRYQVVGMSPDCRRIVFRAPYRYPGILSVGSSPYQLYEWDDGTLYNVAVIPGPGGAGEPTPVESVPGAMDEIPETAIGAKPATDYWHAVSTDGSRTVFTAVSQFGDDEGTRAIFERDATDAGVREGNVAATDISQSETGTPNDGNSRYWTASADGRRVLFTGRYGIARNGSSSGSTECANTPFGNAVTSSGQGCDLYEYDADAPIGEHLTDLSSDSSDPKGAGVVGVLDASADGTYVYFAARGRLGGSGRDEAQNLEAGTYNLYLAHAGGVHLVGFLGESEASGPPATARALVSVKNPDRLWTSQATASGSEFVFESSVGVPGQVSEVYLYSTEDDATICVSCRRDGRPPFAQRLVDLITAADVNAEERLNRPVVLTADGRLYFYSFDPLAPGAVEGDRNLYQWEGGQVSLIAVEPSDVPRAGGEPVASFFAGTGADGDDVYFATPHALVGSDRDGRWDVYDARVGGGLPESATPAPPCDAGVEGVCNSGGGDATSSAPPPTAAFAGPGNPPAKPRHVTHEKRHHKRKHHTKRKGHRHERGTRSGKGKRGSGNGKAGK